jgi:hypothetical protein
MLAHPRGGRIQARRCSRVPVKGTPRVRIEPLQPRAGMAAVVHCRLVTKSTAPRANAHSWRAGWRIPRGRETPRRRVEAGTSRKRGITSCPVPRRHGHGCPILLCIAAHADPGSQAARRALEARREVTELVLIALPEKERERFPSSVELMLEALTAGRIWARHTCRFCDHAACAACPVDAAATALGE